VFSRLKSWVSDRFGWGPIREQLLDRRVAKGAWYFGDGATLLLLLGILVVTGVTMALTYSPTPENAYASVEHITFGQNAGWLVRALHYWSAGIHGGDAVFSPVPANAAGRLQSPAGGHLAGGGWPLFPGAYDVFYRVCAALG
jgi:hypothetical protein